MNKIIMITGATAGFGRATAKKFAQNGYNVIITGQKKRTSRMNLKKNLRIIQYKGIITEFRCKEQR